MGPLSLLDDSAGARCAVLGDPIGQSLSPLIHGTWMAREERVGLYHALQVLAEDLPVALAQLNEAGYTGCNLTIPHKENALSLCDELDGAARAIGAVNTVHFCEGKLHGYNTDAYGFMAALQAQLGDIPLEHVVILGAGGAARAVIYGLKKAGAKDITLLNRTATRAQALAEEFGVGYAAWENAPNVLGRATLMVNTTSLGMAGQPPLAIDVAALPAHAAVADIVYKPLMTELLKSAQARGLKVATGLGMLMHQAQAAYQIWFGARPVVDAALEQSLLEALGEPPLCG